MVQISKGLRKTSQGIVCNVEEKKKLGREGKGEDCLTARFHTRMSAAFWYPVLRDQRGLGCGEQSKWTMQLATMHSACENKKKRQYPHQMANPLFSMSIMEKL
jgi:hypothetical protein